MKYYLKALKNYSNFAGRARRSEYWYFVLFNYLVLILIGLVEVITQGIFRPVAAPDTPLASPFGILYFVYIIFTLVPGLAVAVRRLHDVNKSGWFLLVALIPLVGGIWLLVLFFTDSTFGPNQYGPNPKGIGNVDEIDQIGSHLVS